MAGTTKKSTGDGGKKEDREKKFVTFQLFGYGEQPHQDLKFCTFSC